MRTHVEITKCYLVQVFDKDGKEVNCQYVFGDKEEAKKTGAKLKKDYLENGAPDPFYE